MKEEDYEQYDEILNIEYIEKYTEIIDKLDEIGDEDFSDAELKYYMEIMERITTKLYGII